jgi:hypothetical protein
VGLDVGLTTCALLSPEQAMATPRVFREDEKSLAKAPRRLRKEEKGTPERAARRARWWPVSRSAARGGGALLPTRTADAVCSRLT